MLYALLFVVGECAKPEKQFVFTSMEVIGYQYKLNSLHRIFIRSIISNSSAIFIANIFINAGIIKIETEEIIFSEESVEEFEKLEKYPLQYTFSFAIAEIESQEVEATSISELIGKTMEFESNGNAILYIRTHLEINQNKVQIDQDGAEFILTWTGVTGDINYYDDRAKPNRIYIKAPVKLKQYDSVDQYYQLEYRNKIKD